MTVFNEARAPHNGSLMRTSGSLRMTAGPGPEIGPFIHAMWCKASFLGRPGLSHSCRQAKQNNNTSSLDLTIRYRDVTVAGVRRIAARGPERGMHYLVVSQTRFLPSRRPSRHLQTLRRLLLLTVAGRFPVSTRSEATHNPSWGALVAL